MTQQGARAYLYRLAAGARGKLLALGVLAPAIGLMAADRITPPDGAAASQPAATAEGGPADTRAVVVLSGPDGREREIIGDIVVSEKTVVVKLPASPLVLDRAHIRAIYPSVLSYYEKKCAEIDDRDPEEHLRLARWCLSHGLRSQAQAELEIVLMLNPSDGVAQTMLDSMTRLSPSKRPTATQATEPLYWTRDREALYRRWLAAQSKECREMFALEVQRVLVNSCGAAKCHGPDTSTGPFRLERWGPESPLLQGKTRNNLKATFTTLNLDDLEHSPLLVKPQSDPPAHGGGRVFVGDKQKLLKVLEKWIRTIQPVPAKSSRSEGDEPSPPTNRTQLKRTTRKLDMVRDPFGPPTKKSTKESTKE